MHLDAPQWLWIGAALVPGLGAALWYGLRRYRQAVLALVGRKYIDDLAAPGLFRRFIARGVVCLAAIAALLVALASPRWGVVPREMVVRGADVMIAVDVSRSMLTEDVPPNRLEQTRRVIGLLADRLAGNRMGLIVFAGLAFCQCPLTADLGAFKLMLSAADRSAVPYPGTKIGECISVAVDLLSRYARGTPTLILFTDGEDHDDATAAAVDRARSAGVVIHTVGVGTRAGQPIPIRDERGTVTGYVQDRRTGTTVTSRLNEELLMNIAQKTGGQYYALERNDLRIVDQLADAVTGVGATEMKTAAYDTRVHRFLVFALLALVLLYMDIFIPGSWWARL